MRVSCNRVSRITMGKMLATPINKLCVYLGMQVMLERLSTDSRHQVGIYLQVIDAMLASDSRMLWLSGFFFLIHFLSNLVTPSRSSIRPNAAFSRTSHKHEPPSTSSWLDLHKVTPGDSPTSMGGVICFQCLLLTNKGHRVFDNTNGH